MNRSILTAIILASLSSCTSPTSSKLINESSTVVIGQEAKSTLTQHGADTFRLNLMDNAFVAGVANQITVDVVVTILDPDTSEIESFDSPARGPEAFRFVANKGGIYSIIVKPFEEGSGDYTLVVQKVEGLAPDPGGRVDQLVESMIDESGPGASVAVRQRDQIIFSKGYGMADIEHDVPNTPQTIFHIASVSKQFTAFAIAMLADQGKLSVDDDIRMYLPEMHDFGTPITINQLVHHTSGLRDQWNLLALAGWRLDDVITRNQIMRLIERQRELNFTPGEEFVYCNTGYTLMAEIVTRVSGTPFPEWMDQNVFLPLGMNNTLFYDDHERIVKGRAYSYQQADTLYKKSVLSYANVGATSLFTTVEDLSKWARNFEQVIVGNSNVMKIMEQQYVLNNGDTIDYAFGQGIGKYKGLKSIGHGGADAGYRTMLVRFPEQELSVAVFSNLASFNPGSLSYRIADIFLADQLKEVLEKDEPPQADEKKEPFDASNMKLGDYTGRFYSSELETFYELEVKNDTLVAHHPRHDDISFHPTKPDGFSTTAWWTGNVDFVRNPAGRVTGFKVNSGRVRNLMLTKQ